MTLSPLNRLLATAAALASMVALQALISHGAPRPLFFATFAYTLLVCLFAYYGIVRVLLARPDRERGPMLSGAAVIASVLLMTLPFRHMGNPQAAHDAALLADTAMGVMALFAFLVWYFRDHDHGASVSIEDVKAVAGRWR